jgi:tRNA pseudouridine synthase 9
MSCPQGSKLGKGGIDIIPSEERSAPVPPHHLSMNGNPESLTNCTAKSLSETQSISMSSSTSETATSVNHDAPNVRLLPRETGHDIGMGSPVPLSSEAVGVITRLRNMKARSHLVRSSNRNSRICMFQDEDEDWSRWRDVVFRAKAALSPSGIKVNSLPPQNRRKRGGPAFANDAWRTNASNGNMSDSADLAEQAAFLPGEESVSQLSMGEALEKLKTIEQSFPPQLSSLTRDGRDEATYCPECYLPLHPDPKPEKLYIFLHALRYSTSLGTFETEMPEWAKEGWVWDRG